MTRDVRIALQTFLGFCFEELVATLVLKEWPDFLRSPDVATGLISPDLLRVTDKLTFCAITATPARDTFRKKRWRYVHEVFSNKQTHGKDLLAVNINLSQPGAIQGLDKGILAALFDYEIKANAFASFDEIVKWFSAQFDPSAKPKTLAIRKVAELVGLLICKSFENELTPSLMTTFSEKPRNAELWQLVASHKAEEANRAIAKEALSLTKSYIRPISFGLCLLEPASLPATLSDMQKGRAFPESVAQACRLGGLGLRKALGGYRLDPDLLRSTLECGFSLDDIIRCVTALYDSDEMIHIAYDLKNSSRASEWVDYLLGVFGRNQHDAFVRNVVSEFEKARTTRSQQRLFILDYLLLVCDISITHIDKVLANRFGDLGHGNRVQCMISARCPMRVSFTRDETEKVAKRLWTIAMEETDIRRLTKAEALGRIKDGRISSLGALGSEINPASTLFEWTCTRLRFSAVACSSQCLIGDFGLRGRGIRVERLYACEAGNASVLVKVLSGYKGGFEHKAEELAGRGWVLRYRLLGGRAVRNVKRLVFVCEGEWDASAVSMILKSGWDSVVPLVAIVNAKSKADLEGRLS
jgi:hypothetical protein